MRITIGQLPGAIRREEKRIEAAIKKALEVTAVRAEVPIKERVPVAFGELRDSIKGFHLGHHGGPVTSVDAPHAGAVEQGSMPHRPDYEALLRWVKLRGMQGLTKTGRVRRSFPRSWGPTTPGHAMSVAQTLKQYEVRGKRGVGRHTPIDAARQVADAIAKHIEKVGTKPHWFVRDSLSDIQQILNTEVYRRVKIRRRP